MLLNRDISIWAFIPPHYVNILFASLNLLLAKVQNKYKTKTKPHTFWLYMSAHISVYEFSSRTNSSLFGKQTKIVMFINYIRSYRKRSEKRNRCKILYSSQLPTWYIITFTKYCSCCLKSKNIYFQRVK